jgi:macrocin-O-methyltransferase TylF-like protien
MALSIPIILSEYFRANTGKDYGVGFLAKLRLVRKMARNRKKVTTASHFLEHLVMATQLLKVPASVEGCVVECGSFKGGSAANLSLVCALCKRQLEIFDSFEGLPAPSDGDKHHAIVNEHEVHTYAKGALCGTLAEVRANVSRNGAVSVCNFNVGYFEQTLSKFEGKCVLIFLDVDLVESLKTCFKHLWPLLQDGCYLFTHEAHHSEIAALFFEEQWWQSNMKCKAPGLIGAGTGLGLLPSSGGFRSALGYTVKNPQITSFEVSPQIGVLS